MLLFVPEANFKRLGNVQEDRYRAKKYWYTYTWKNKYKCDT